MLTAAPCTCTAKRSPMASRMLQPVLMAPNADTNEEGQSKVRSAMQVRISFYLVFQANHLLSPLPWTISESSPEMHSRSRLRANAWIACMPSSWSDPYPLPLCRGRHAYMPYWLMSTPSSNDAEARASAASISGPKRRLVLVLSGVRARHPERGAAPDAQTAQYHGRGHQAGAAPRSLHAICTLGTKSRMRLRLSLCRTHACTHLIRMISGSMLAML